MNGIFYAFTMYFDAKFGRQYKPHLSALICIFKKLLPFAPMSIFYHALLTRWGKNRLEGPALQLVTFVPLLLCRDDRLQRLLRVYRPPRLEVHQ